MQQTFSPTRLMGRTQAPPSKSEAHRRMICAGLTRGETVLQGYMPSGDMEATEKCLRALGAETVREEGALRVTGLGEGHELLPVYECGESGSTLRFMVPIALALTGGGIFRMRGHLSRRPMDVYRDLFVPRGVTWRMRPGTDGAAELTVIGSLPAGDYVLPGSVSSQFVSGLLFALPLRAGDSTLKVEPPVESSAYIRMTVQALLDSGIYMEEKEPFCWKIPGGQRYRAAGGMLEGDWSQAAVWLCASALGSEVQVERLFTRSLQGDRRITEALTAFGAKVTQEGDCVRVEGNGSLRGTVLDMRNTPDIAPILALVGQLAQGETRLSGCGRLRLKECDRLAATCELLNALGGNAAVQGDDLVLHGVRRLKGGVTVSGYDDHRMVMLASIAALQCEQPVTVTGVEALNKSWPDYLDAYRALGGLAE